MNNLTFGNERYQYYETICGGSGAGPDFDGTDAIHTHMTNSRLTDPEVLEWRFPVLLESFEIRHGSGGAGRHKGGDGTIRRLRFREQMTAAILASHRVVPPFGLEGGQPGQTGRNWVERAGGGIEQLSGTDSTEMQPGDVFVIQTPSGGGFGAAERGRAAAGLAPRRLARVSLDPMPLRLLSIAALLAAPALAGPPEGVTPEGAAPPDGASPEPAPAGEPAPADEPEPADEPAMVVPMSESPPPMP